jgi:hypothetical protein
MKPQDYKVEVRKCFGSHCSVANFEDFIYDKVLVTKMFTKKMDFERKYDEIYGSYVHMDVTTGKFPLSTYSKFISKVALRFNLVEMFDNYFLMGLPSEANKKYFLDYSYQESGEIKIPVKSRSDGQLLLQ